MNALEIVEGFVEVCERADRIEALTQRFQHSLQQLGFRYFACGSHVDPLNPRQAVMVLDYPRAWIEAYSTQQLHCIDPVFMRADATAMPFFWDADDFKAGMTGAQRRMQNEARRFGIEHGYTIPIHSPHRAGLARASCSVIPDAPTLHAHCYFAVQLMAGYLFETAARLIGEQGDALLRPQLTSRERQCLELAAQGKGDWDIAMLLGLRECTVHSYVESAKRRFDAATRVQAIVCALASYQIAFGDVIRPRRAADHRLVRPPNQLR